MGRKTNYVSDIYLMYETEFNRNKTLVNENKYLKLENNILKSDISNLKNSRETKIKREVEKETKKLKEENAKLKEDLTNAYQEIERLKKIHSNVVSDKDSQYVIDKLTNQVNKDSTNSGIPTSQEMKCKKKKTGANTYNHREKTNRKSGGQIGHTGITLTKKKVEEMIKEHKLSVKKIIHHVHGNKGTTTKYSIGIEIKPYIEKHIIIYDKKYTDKLPSSLYSDVTYNDDVKLIVTILGNYCGISYGKIRELIYDLTKHIVEISEGTIDNIYSYISEKTIPTINNITNNLLNETYTHTDETTTSENGDPSYYRGYANSKNVLYKYHNHKGDNPVIEDNILPRFYGTIISDHDLGIFKYGLYNQDCIVHIGRYCKESAQNIYEINWTMELYYLLLRVERGRKILTKFGQNYFHEEDIKKIENEYDEILKKAYEQNQLINSSYWKEKAITLYNRLVKFKNSVLFYIHDFDISCDNNSMELLLRMIKGKTKISGGFRSKKGGERFGNIMSVIKTCKLRNIGVYDSLKLMLKGESLFA